MKTLGIGPLVASAVLALSLSSTARASLPFVEDDYGRAVAQARTRGVPLFVEAWAPW